jgi:quercetin dioxygenase-like cupin family protein
MMLFGNVKDSPVEEIAEGVTRRQLSKGERIQVFLLEMKGGRAAPPHAHVNEQASYVVKGRFETTVGDEKGMMTEGCSVRIPSNVTHSGYIFEDTILIDVYSPPR